MPSTATFLRTSDVADLLHASPKTMARWAKDGKLPYTRTLGGHRRYPEAAIRELAAPLTMPAAGAAKEVAATVTPA